MDLQNIDINGEGLNSFVGTAGDWAVKIGIIFISVLLLGIIFWFFWRELKFKIPVVLHRVVGENQIIESSDRASINKKTGEISLKKTKVKQSIPDPKFFIKTLKSWKLYGRWDGHKAIQWQKLSYNSPLNFEPDTYDVYNQMAWRIKNATVRHMDQSTWDKYGNQIMMMGTVLVIAVVLIVLFDRVGELGPQLRAGLSEWAATVREVGVQKIS